MLPVRNIRLICFIHLTYSKLCDWNYIYLITVLLNYSPVIAALAGICIS